MRLELAALRAKRAGRNLVTEFQFEDPTDPTVAYILAQKDQDQYEPTIEFRDLKDKLHACGDDPYQMQKAVIQYGKSAPDRSEIIIAVQSAGYDVGTEDISDSPNSSSFSQRKFGVWLFVVFILTLSIVLAGEWFHLFDRLSLLVPWYLWGSLLALGGYPVFKKVMQAALRGKIISHSYQPAHSAYLLPQHIP